jgi:hypothetical protein
VFDSVLGKNLPGVGSFYSPRSAKAARHEHTISVMRRDGALCVSTTPTKQSVSLGYSLPSVTGWHVQDVGGRATGPGNETRLGLPNSTGSRLEIVI